MNRRHFLIGAGVGTVGVIALGGRGAYVAHARSSLTKEMRSVARKQLVDHATSELVELPDEARERIRTWFHGPSLNTAEYVNHLASPSFREELRLCPTEEDRMRHTAYKFTRYVVSETEIMNAVQGIIEDIGRRLDRGWTEACAAIGAKWNTYLRDFSSEMKAELRAELKPMLREQFQEAVTVALDAQKRPAITDVGAALQRDRDAFTSELALLLLDTVSLTASNPVAGVVVSIPIVPLFFVNTLRSITNYVFGVEDTGRTDRQTQISNKMAAIGNQLGDAFAIEVKQRIAELEDWRQSALEQGATKHAYEAISFV